LKTKCKHERCARFVPLRSRDYHHYCYEHINDKYFGHCPSSFSSSRKHKRIPAEIVAKCQQLLQKKEKQHYLTLFQRYAVFVLIALDFSIKEIASHLHCDVRTVDRWVYRSVEHIDHLSRSGADEILTEEEKTLIVACAVDQPFTTPADIKRELDLDCSTRTIDRVLIQAGLFGRVAKLSYPYSDSQRQVRLSLAHNLLLSDFHLEHFWEYIFFTDESSVQMGVHGNRIYVRRPRGDVYKFMDKYVYHDKSKLGSEKIKFFGGFCFHGVGKLHFYERMNGNEMKKIINENVLPECRRLFPRGGWQLLHDNGRTFRNNDVVAYIRRRGITQINDEVWPSHSPDFNPIENLWSDVFKRVFDRNPHTLVELKSFFD
jgi:transposase